MLRRSKGLLIAGLLLVAVEGLAVLVQLARIPADPKNSLLFGFSLSRLALMAAALGMALSGAGLAAVFARQPQLYARVAGWLDGRDAARLVSAALALLAGGCWLALVLLRTDLERSASAYERLQPVLRLGFLAGAQGLALLVIWRNGFQRPRGWGRVQRAALAALAAVLVLFLLVGLTGFGVTPDLYAWGPPGVPLLAWQVALALAAGCAVYLLPGFGTGTPRGRWLDIALCLGIWALAAGLWLSQPLQPSFFNPQVRPPNMEYYPYSDAGYYDYIAEGLISGNGFLGGRGVTRPVYILFLGLLHLVGGHSYARVVLLQTLALAAFPMVLYLLGRGFHSRAAGLVVAGFAILRELNAYAATPLTEVSHAKMLLSDLPAALGMTLLVLACFRWLSQPHKRWLPLVVGGAAGLLALVRAQSLLVLPFVALLALFAYRWKWRRIIEAGVLIGVGAALALVPWMSRNAAQGNGFSIDQPGNQVIIFAQRYSFELQRWPPREANESEAAYSQRMLAIARDFALQNPAYTAGFIGAHFLNNVIDAAAVLPLRLGFDDARDNWTIDSLFWEAPLTTLDASGVTLLLLNLAVISVGIGTAWARWRAAGLLPLVITLAYSLSNAIARNSGWRYVLPVDWSGYFYFAIGALTLFAWALAVLGRARTEGQFAPDATLPTSERFPWRRVMVIGLLFLAAGVSVPLSEHVFPARYPAMTKAQLAGQILASPALEANGVDVAGLRAFLASENSVILYGRGLYPRYYTSGQGELGNGWPAYAIREGSRLAFLLAQADGVRQVLLRQESAPRTFPNAADAYVVGCADAQGYVQALFVVLPGKAERVYLRPETRVYTCPLP